MFERYTERARQVIVLAQEEARNMRHDSIGVEHLLLGLIREEEGVASRVLFQLNVKQDRVTDAILSEYPKGEREEQGGQIPFTPRAKKVCEIALREALSLGHNYIGTEHLLLALGRECEGLAARILADLDADPEKVRNAVVYFLNGPASNNEDRWQEYLICKKRGHEALPQVLASNPPKNRCRHCKTVFWSEVVEREQGAPTEPKAAAA